VEVPFLDLKAVNAPYAEDMALAVRRVIDKGWFILGEECEAFEAEFAAYIGVRHAIGVGSGLDALALVLRSWIAGGLLCPGDSIAVPANTFIGSILAISENGLSPLLVEPDEASFNLSADGVTWALDRGAKGVMAVHLYGRAAPVDDIAQICKLRGVPLLEDAAQGHGAWLRGRRIGSFGDASAFSFYPGKNLGALGDGGAVTTNDDDLARHLRALRNYGSEKKYYNEYIGVNSRLDEMQAAMLRVKLRGLDQDNARRRAIAHRYLNEISSDRLTLPKDTEETESHVWHLFIVRCAERDALAQSLRAKGIGTQIHYPTPPHLQPCYRGSLDHFNLPITEQIHRDVLSLPLSPTMLNSEVTAVIAAVNSF